MLKPMKLTWGNRLLAFFTGEVFVDASPHFQEPFLGFSKATLSQWQNSSDRLSWAVNQMKDPMFREMLGVLNNNSNLGVNLEKIDPTKASFLLGFSQGMKQQVITILAMSQAPHIEQQEIPQDYSEPANIEEV